MDLGGEYWGRMPELVARSFEAYIEDKLKEHNIKDTYLVRNNKVGDSDTGYTEEILRQLYPQDKEREKINQAFDNLFKVAKEVGFIKEKETEIEKSIRLFKGLKAKAFGKQLSLFGDNIEHHEGETKQGKEGTLVLKNHRWRYLDEKIKHERPPKTTFSKDPSQTSIMHEIASRPPLQSVKEGLDEIEKIISQEKLKEAEQLADYYVREANAQKPIFLADMDNIAREHNLELPSKQFGNFAVKSKESILKKIMRNEAKGKSESNKNLTDILRTTMIIRNPKQFDAIKDSIEKQGYKIIETDNFYEYDKGAGYKHIALKLVKQDGDKLVKELLLMRPNMLEAKLGLGHDLYDLEKNIEIILPKLKEKGADYFGMVGLEIIRHLAKQFYEYAYFKDLEDEKFYSPSTLERTSSKPSRIPPRSKLRKSSSDLTKRLITVLKSDLGKAVWRPIRAKLKASSNDISPFNAGSSNKEDIADLILSSIVDPFMKVYDKYSKSLKTNVINRQTNSKINLL
jgi:hypothetical protein